MKRLIDFCMPLFLGFCAYLCFFDLQALNPVNTQWLAGQGDLEQAYLGWAFFRDSPWSLPPGLNPAYGLELSSSIVFTDSNPLLALVFKIFALLLPDRFQYFGPWTLLCLMLQAWFAWQIASLKSPSLFFKFTVTVLLLLVPPLYWRKLHVNLMAHFLLLGSLYLIFRQDSSLSWRWLPLLCVSALVHSYLLAMVAALWLGTLADACWHRTISVCKCIFRILGTCASILFCMWLGGYFAAAGEGAGTGYGFYKLNVLSLADSAGWSWLLPDLPSAPGEYEGFNYMGLGLLFLWLCSLPAVAQNRKLIISKLKSQPFLLAICILLTAFAITPSIGIGGWQLSLPLPRILQDMANILRSSGRMFWPVFYLLVFGILFCILRFYSPRTVACLLALAVFIQAADTMPGWLAVRQRDQVAAADFEKRLQSDFWRHAFARYAKVRYIPPKDIRSWAEVGRLALAGGLPLDYAYLARKDPSLVEAAQERAYRVLTMNEAEPDALYVLDPRSAALAMDRIDKRTDLLANIDGFTILAPRWKTFDDAPRIPELSGVDLPEAPIGQAICFGGQQSPFLIWGWGEEEDWGTWSEGNRAVIMLDAGGQKPGGMELAARALVNKAHPFQRVRIYINGVFVKELVLASPDQQLFHIPLPERALRDDGLLRIELLLPDAISVRKIMNSDDRRRLGLGLVSLRLV